MSISLALSVGLPFPLRAEPLLELMNTPQAELTSGVPLMENAPEAFGSITQIQSCMGVTAAVERAAINPVRLPITAENSWGTDCVTRAAIQYAAEFTPGALGG